MINSSSINVAIPKEIREYKEKFVFGLTVRQALTTFIALAIVVPLYIYGKKFVNEELISWLVIIIALPILACGYIKINGMPFERFCVCMVQFFIAPSVRLFKSENAWRDWADEYDKLTMPKSAKERWLNEKNRKLATIERAYLMEQAEMRGDDNFDVDSVPLVTVAEPKNSSGGNNGKKPKKDEGKKPMEKRSILQERAEVIEQKIAYNPDYIPTDREFSTLKKWKAQQHEIKKREVLSGEKQTIKKNEKMKKRRTAKTVLPKTVQQSIPYVADYDEGLFEVEPNKYSKMYTIKDINYTLTDQESRENAFGAYAEALNYFSEDMHVAIIIDNRIVSREEQENKVFNKMQGTALDQHRKELNRVLRTRIIAGGDDIRVEKYITVTIDADSPIEALLRFHKIDIEVKNNFARCGSNAEVVGTVERLSYLHDKFRRGHEGELNINFDLIKQQGISSKDYIAPSAFVFNKNYLAIDDCFYRVLYLNNLPARLSDEFLNTLSDNSFPVITTLTFKPVAQDKALKLVGRQLTSVEKDQIEAQKRAIRAGYSPDMIPHKIKDAKPEAEQLKIDLTSNNQKLFFGTITCMVYGSTLEELEENCASIVRKAKMYSCTLQTLNYQQEQGFRLTLPVGYSPNVLQCDRAMPTGSAAAFMPFKVQEMFQEGGIYYGLHSISKNLVVCNRLDMQTPSGFILGMAGSGKSFAAKREALAVLLRDEKTGVLILDPENEYGDFTRALGGEVVKISADSDVHINLMDMEMDYGLDENDDSENTPLSVKKSKALKKKSAYLMSIVERMMNTSTNSSDATAILPQQKTIIDMCVRKTYEDYLNSDFDKSRTPTLLDFQAQLDIAAAEERATGTGVRHAQDIADATAYYTRGCLDVFAHQSNVDLNNRFITFNVRDLDEQLKQMAQIVMFDFVWNRMLSNKNSGKRTYLYADEIHTMFKSYYSAEYMRQLYKRGRKFGLIITGMTQNVEDLLLSEQARGMIGNSQFVLMLNQAPRDLEILSDIMHITENERTFVSNVDAGCGLLFAQGVKVPFFDEFPKDSYLYGLMTTKFGEDLSLEERKNKCNELIKSYAAAE